jgi:hypothetical protein
VYQRTGNDVAVAGLAGSWAAGLACPFSQYLTSLINMTSFQTTVVYQRAGNNVAGLAGSCAGRQLGWHGLIRSLCMTSLINMTSFQAKVVYQRAGNDVAVARLAGSWAGMSVLSTAIAVNALLGLAGEVLHECSSKYLVATATLFGFYFTDRGRY